MTFCDQRDKDGAFRCDAMVLGMLIKREKSIGIWPPPDSPYQGLSFKNLAQQIRAMVLMTACEEAYNNEKRRYGYGSSYEKPSCEVKERLIQSSISPLEQKHFGLSLNDLVSRVEWWRADFHLHFRSPLSTTK